MTRFPVPQLMVVIAALALFLPDGVFAQSKTVVTQQVLKQSGPSWTFTFRYPKLTVPGALMGVNAMTNDFNRGMRQVAQQSLAQFKREVAGWKLAPGAPVFFKSSVDTTYTMLHTQGVVSVKFDQYQMMAGAAHPVTTVITRNWLPGGPFVQLSDLFDEDAYAFTRLSQKVAELLQAQAKANNFELVSADGFGPSARNFKAFGMTKAGLVIFFQRGQVAAGAVGNLAVVVPWKTIPTLFTPAAWKQIQQL